jgi:hypothetical protein
MLKNFWVAEVTTLFATNTLNSKRKERQIGEEGGDAVTDTEFVIIRMNEGNLRPLMFAGRARLSF